MPVFDAQEYTSQVIFLRLTDKEHMALFHILDAPEMLDHHFSATDVYHRFLWDEFRLYAGIVLEMELSVGHYCDVCRVYHDDYHYEKKKMVLIIESFLSLRQQVISWHRSINMI